MSFSNRLTGLTDNQLIDEIRNGNDPAFTELSKRYHTRLKNFISRHIDDQAQSEDLVQETFWRVFRKLDSFDNSRCFKTWLFTIASNLYKNELTFRKRKPEVICFSHLNEDIRKHSTREFDVTKISAPDSFEENDQDNGPMMTISDLNRAVELLIPSRQKVFKLHHIDGIPYKEIALMLNLNMGTVKSQLSRAKGDLSFLLSHLRRKDA